MCVCVCVWVCVHVCLLPLSFTALVMQELDVWFCVLILPWLYCTCFPPSHAPRLILLVCTTCLYTLSFTQTVMVYLINPLPPLTSALRDCTYQQRLLLSQLVKILDGDYLARLSVAGVSCSHTASLNIQNYLSHADPT